MDAFCTVAQYEARFGEVSDEGILQECLDDATAELDAILDAYDIIIGDQPEGYTDKLMRVCRSMANRIMPTSASMPVGVTQTSITGGPYSQSFTFSAPYGVPRPLPSELEMLGIATSKIGSIRPKIGGGRC